MMEGMHPIALSSLRVSNTHAQTERRKRFDKAALAELTESIRTVGLLQPIVVRPIDGDEYEVVAGERRFIAARAAGIDVTLCSVRQLTDEQVLEVQLVENLQRADLHPLDEADGYEALTRLHGYTVDDLAAKVGKSKAYVYGRLKLLSLGKVARKAFSEGKISPSIAGMIARIPLDELQADALEEILRGDMNSADAANYIREYFMLKLGGAGFPTSDAELLPAAGACSACPKNTAQQPELFGDVKGALCTDPKCFTLKRSLWTDRRLEQAKAAGQHVIEGKEAKKLSPYGSTHSIEGGYIALDEHCWEDSKNRTYRQIIGKKVVPALLVVEPRKDDLGAASTIVEIVQRSEVKDLLPKKAQASANESWRAENKKRDAKVKAEQAIRLQLASLTLSNRATIRPFCDRKENIALGELPFIAQALWEGLGHDSRRLLYQVWGLEPVKVKNRPNEFPLPKASPAGLAEQIIACCLARELQVNSYAFDAKPERLHAIAEYFHVDVKDHRKRLTAELAATQKAKAAKNKGKK